MPYLSTRRNVVTVSRVSEPTGRSPMARRMFLIRGGSVLLTLPAGWALVSCGSSYSNPSTANVSAGELQFTSSAVEGHTHDFSISMQDLSQPPSTGVSGNTTAAAGHVHVVSLSQAELGEIQANQVVSKDTSVVAGHMHTFQFSLAAANGGGSSSGTSTGGTAGGGTGAAGKLGGY
jgi:hypothetical protein